MRVLSLPLLFLLIGAAPAEVPQGRFQTWAAYKKAPLQFVAAGIRVDVEALPCPRQPIGDTSCAVEGYNNQASVTVSAPGVPRYSVPSDPQAERVRVAVVRFRKGDPRPGVIIESQYGGSGGSVTAQFLVPAGEGFKVVALGAGAGAPVQGMLADLPRDLSGDGIVDFQLQDGAFDSRFACNACSPRPPRLFAVKDGRLLDESRDPALRHLFAVDMQRLAPMCLSDKPDRNGACAAYVADAARAGRFKTAWAAMLKHYDRGDSPWLACTPPMPADARGPCPAGHRQRFPDALRAFLLATGYLPA